MVSLEDRVRGLERSIVTLRIAVGLVAVVAACTIAALLVNHVATNRNTLRVESVTAKNISVVDGKGVVRVRLSGAVPDAVMHGGRTTRRGSQAAGVIIYDEEGIERGGYLTSVPGSNVILTLDSKYEQAALLVAGPDEMPASALTLWTGDSAIELRSDVLGSRISTSKDKRVEWQMPPIELSADACRRQRELELQFPGEAVCRERYSVGVCRVCIGK